MRPVTQTLSGVSVGAPIVVDYRASNFITECSGVISGGGAMTWKVQYTTDDVFAAGYNAATGNWFDTTVATLTAQTTSNAGQLPGPVTAVRFNITAYTSGTLTGKVICTSGFVA